MAFNTLENNGCFFLRIHKCFCVPIALFVMLVSPITFAVDKNIALNRIANEEEFQRIAAQPEASSLARTEVVKFMVDRKDHRKLWFFNTDQYPYHYAFARDHLNSSRNPIPDHQIFNLREYSSKNRRFEMGTIVHYRDQNLWTIQLISGDNLETKEIFQLFLQVKSALWVGSELHFLPLSSEQEESTKTFASQMPIVTVDQVFKGMQYQPLTQGHVLGYLRIVKGALDPVTVKPDQILVLEKLPEEVPVSAGIISQQLQAPLAHIALLCGSRGTPNMSLRNALMDKKIQALDGQLVELNIGTQEYSLKAATLEDAQVFWKKLRQTKPQIPAINIKEKRLLNVEALRLPNTAFAGAKAAQLGEVASLQPALKIPGGFIVPLGFYIDQINKPHIASLIDQVLNEKNSQASLSIRYKQLETLRNAIESEPVDPNLIANIRSKMIQSGHNGRWILRSSTNAEDLAGFNGAGLYRSIKIKANATDAELAKALVQVWASVWLQAAFDERNWYAVDHRAVGMAVLAQPYVENVVANGVAITANPFAEFRPGVLINTQVIGGSVTGAEGNEIPEQHLVYTFEKQLSFELLSKSSRMEGGKTIMTKSALANLIQQLMQMHKHFLPLWGGDVNAVDVEFLVAADDSIVILQARPYRVNYSKEQKMDWIYK